MAYSMDSINLATEENVKTKKYCNTMYSVLLHILHVMWAVCTHPSNHNFIASWQRLILFQANPSPHSKKKSVCTFVAKVKHTVDHNHQKQFGLLILVNCVLNSSALICAIVISSGHCCSHARLTKLL